MRDQLRQITIEDGLPSNIARAIVQTGNGLARFNGRSFTPIGLRGPRSTAQGLVQALAEGARRGFMGGDTIRAGAYFRHGAG